MAIDQEYEENGRTKHRIIPSKGCDMTPEEIVEKNIPNFLRDNYWDALELLQSNISNLYGRLKYHRTTLYNLKRSEYRLASLCLAFNALYKISVVEEELIKREE